ncbi:hypothetical protein OFH05_004295 [Escherichia albertii]|nr:hypothetical protein [Escherichia albertii]
MTTFTKEQLISHARESVSYLEDLKGRVSKEGADCKVVLEMVERDLELARIALTSLEAEPVGEFYEYKPGDWYQRSVGDKAPKWVPLYAAPPVLEVQADVAQAIENLKQKLVECYRYNYCADAVKGVEDACLAAMLHGAEPVSQTYKLNELSGNSPVTPDGWVMVPKQVTPEISNAINVVGQRCTCGNCSQRLWDLLLDATQQGVNRG